MNKEHLHPEGRPYTKEEFVEKIKTDKSFAERFANLGPVYGSQWRSWSGASYVHPPSDKEESIEQQWYRMGHNSVANKTVDQIANVINLLKTDPDSRRMIVNAWNVADLPAMVLPPCHMMFQFYTRELSDEERAKLMDKLYGIKNPEDRILPWYRGDIDAANIPTRAISLRWDQRSCDIALGIPMNISAYALLLMMIAKQVNMVPEDLIGDLGDCHIYNDHIEGMREQLTRTPYELPTVEISDKVVEDLSEYTVEDFKLKNYVSHPKIYFPLSN